jgi:trehalose 6-phosphate synthase
VLLQVLQPSRLGIPEYVALRDQIQVSAARINSRFTVPGRKPPVILNEHGFKTEVAIAHIANAEAVIINSLRDGMNLVALESEVIQTYRDRPASLVLSRYAGAATVLPGAIHADPHNHFDVARAIRSAIVLPTYERLERNRQNLQHIEKQTSRRWTQQFLQTLISN